MLRNPHIAKEIDRLSSPDTPNAEPREGVLKRARKIIDRMATRQRDWVLRIFYILLSFLFRALFRSVHIDRNGLTKFHEKWEKLEKGVGVMFLPTHKSHIDYLVLSYVSAIYDLPLPVIAAGDNLNFPIIGALFQHSGAFFMRRSLGDDTLYRAILEGYLEEVLKSGSTLEFFIEGGRSRDGTILPPKYGLLNVVLDAVKAGRLKDVCIVPISVDYEHCPDIGSYVKYMMGGKKKKESLMGLLKNAHSILSMSCGDAFVTLGSPLSLQELLKRMEQEDATLDVRHRGEVCRRARVPRHAQQQRDDDLLSGLRGADGVPRRGVGERGGGGGVHRPHPQLAARGGRVRGLLELVAVDPTPVHAFLPGAGGVSGQEGAREDGREGAHRAVLLPQPVHPLLPGRCGGAPRVRRAARAGAHAHRVAGGPGAGGGPGRAASSARTSPSTTCSRRRPSRRWWSAGCWW